jgi:predicted RNase H-like nuclease (RuvC/YqgF family)
VQGRELEKLQKQLDKVNSSVGGNEREYQALVRMLEETTRKWELEWKGFCDHVQDLEEERLDFIKDNIWVYANAVSSVCVTDDEVSHGRLRLTELPKAESDIVLSRASACVWLLKASRL